MRCFGCVAVLLMRVCVILRVCVSVPGQKTPDTALYESLKMLCSLLVTLVGKGLYGANCSAETRFINQGTAGTLSTTHTVVHK